MLRIDNITKSYGERDIFADTSLRVNARERIALIGVNGSGKTTLFRMINREESPELGSISLDKDARLGFLPQEIETIKGRSLLEEVMDCSPEQGDLSSRMELLADKLSDGDEEANREHLAEYGKAQEMFEELGGY
jgi:ATP-binding cassette subfamily F protein 3